MVDWKAIAFTSFIFLILVFTVIKYREYEYNFNGKRYGFRGFIQTVDEHKKTIYMPFYQEVDER